MTISYNPFDPAQVDDDEEVLTQLRHEARVAEVLPGVYYVTRHDDVAEISRDAKRFPQAPFRPLEEDTRSPDELQLGESNPPGHTRVRKILAENLSVPEDSITMDSRFQEDLDADSLDLVEAVLALEEEFGVTIPEEEMEGVKTVGQAIQLVAAKLGVAA